MYKKFIKSRNPRMSHCLMNKAPSVLWLPLVNWNKMYRIQIITGIPEQGSSCAMMRLHHCSDATLPSSEDVPHGTWMVFPDVFYKLQVAGSLSLFVALHYCVIRCCCYGELYMQNTRSQAKWKDPRDGEMFQLAKSACCIKSNNLRLIPSSHNRRTEQ